MALTVTSICPRQYDGRDGRRLYDALRPYLVAGSPVEVSFEGVVAVSTSFVNEGLIRLLDSFSYDTVRTVLRLTNVRPTVARVIQRRFAFEAAREAA